MKFTSYLGSDMLPNYTTQGLRDPLATSFEDVTLARFTADIKLTVPGTANDPQRFGHRAEFLLSAANKDKWLQWRTEKTRDFFTKLQREVFTQNLLTTDPQMVVWGFCDLVMQTGHEQPLREFARVLRALPKAKFQPALDTTLESNLVLRELREDGKLWFIAANPGYWPLQAEVHVTGANGIHDATSTALVAAIIANGKTILPLKLKPYEVRAFRVDSATAKLQGWKNEAVPEIELAHTRAVIADAEKLLNDRAFNARLPNADREFLTAQIAAANIALTSQHIAKAWSLVSDSRFWSLARTQWIGGKPR